MSSHNLLKKLDESLFNQVSNIQSLNLYSRFQEALANLSDDNKNIVKYIISTLIILLPLTIVIIFWIQNHQLKSDLNTRKAIYQKANHIIAKNMASGNQEKKLMAPNAPRNRQELITKINMLLQRNRIPITSVKIENFKSTSFTETIQRNSAHFIFNELNTEQLSRLSNILIFSQKAKIQNIEINRHPTKKYINGKISIIYLSSPGV